jgi:hypothetical protein
MMSSSQHEDNKKIIIVSKASSLGTNTNTTNTVVNDSDSPIPLSHREQVSIINRMFLGHITNDNDRQQEKFYTSLISKKCTGYKQQDVSNTIYDINWFITHEELLELLVASKLICYYCRKACYVHYTEPFCQEQWTLERISNDHGHNRNNVVIACLKCNLARGTKSSDKFKLGKQLRFIKI